MADVTINFDSLRRPVRGGDREPGPYPYYGASGVVDQVANYIFDGDYLLVAEDGENLRSRTTPVAFMARGKFWVNNHAHVVRANDLAVTEFLAYALSVADLTGYLSGSTLPKLTQAAMNSIRLDLPPLPTQRAIAEVLGALDDKIAANNGVVRGLDELLEAEFLVVQRDADTGARLGDLVALRYGKALPATARVPGRVQVFGSGGVAGTHAERLCQGPGIIVGRKGTVGAVYWSDDDFYPIDTVFYVESLAGLALEYLYFLLRSLGLNELNSDSAVPGLNRDQAYAQPVRVGRDQDVARFNALARVLFARRAQASRESVALAELRDTLLPHLMSGRLSVREAETQVEEVL